MNMNTAVDPTSSKLKEVLDAYDDKSPAFAFRGVSYVPKNIPEPTAKPAAGGTFGGAAGGGFGGSSGFGSSTGFGGARPTYGAGGFGAAAAPAAAAVDPIKVALDDAQRNAPEGMHAVMVTGFTDVEYYTTKLRESLDASAEKFEKRRQGAQELGKKLDDLRSDLRVIQQRLCALEVAAMGHLEPRGISPKARPTVGSVVSDGERMQLPLRLAAAADAVDRAAPVRISIDGELGSDLRAYQTALGNEINATVRYIRDRHASAP